MADHFNQLTPAEAERLAMLAEECAEVIQVVGKILRHGYESYHPETPDITNRELLGKELSDLAAVETEMIVRKDISSSKFGSLGRAWKRKLRSAHHQESENDRP